MRIILSIILFVSFADDDLANLAKDLKHKDVKVRLKAVEGIHAKGETAAPIARDLCAAMLDRDARVGKSALAAVEKVAPDLYKNLSTYWLDVNSDNRFTALSGMSKPGYAPVIPVLVYRVNLYAGMKEWGLAEVHLRALRGIDLSDPDVIKLVKGIATNSENATFKNAAQGYLVEWCGNDAEKKKEVYPIFLATLKKPTFAVPACKNIAAFGALAKDALPTLRMLKMSSDLKIREAATDATEAIEKALAADHGQGPY